MGLDGLKQISCVNIGKLVIPNLCVVLVDGISIDVSPQSECRFCISEDNVEERYNSVFLSIFLTFLVVLVIALQDAGLDVHPKHVL